MDIKESLTELLARSIQKTDELADLKEIPEVALTSPKLRKFGDFSCNIALALAQKLNKAPLGLACKIEEQLRKDLQGSNLLKKIDKIEVKGNGFINFFLSKKCLYEILEQIRKEKNKFGRLKLGQNKSIHLEFVSANPTGPLNVAHGRQAAFGDTLANLLQFAGYRLHREYYLNDEGTQIDILGESVRANCLELLGVSAQFPPAGYQGKYISELARELVNKYGRRLLKKKENFFSVFAYSRILKTIKEDLSAFGVHYNCWFSQKKLSKTGRIAKVLDFLKKEGFLYQKEGAWWLTTSKFGDDKDRVVIKSDAKTTYITPDIAYHQIKYAGKFDQVINVWGPDHHGYIARLKAAVSALGYDAKRLQILIVQLVSLSCADKIIPMSTRLGQYISLHDIIQAVGRDAARFFFLMRNRDAHLNFDLELAKSKSLENPVYYIQYAHARICNILKFAKTTKSCQIGFVKNLDLSLLNKPEELNLIQGLRKFPTVVESCVLSLEPHRITTYLQDLAKRFHHFYERQKVVTEDSAIMQARLILVDATRIVLNNGLCLLAVSAPEKM